MHLQDGGKYTLLNGVQWQCPTLQLGFATKGKSGKSKGLTAAQAAFLKWCYAQGDAKLGGDKSKKFTAYIAMTLMPQHGSLAGRELYPTDDYWKPTANGACTFRVSELLDHWTIKPWFSRAKAALDKGLEVASGRATPADELAAMLAGQKAGVSIGGVNEEDSDEEEEN